MLLGCASPEPVPPVPAEQWPDFTGAWEKNYALSDDFNSKFSLYLFDIRRSLDPTLNGTLQGASAGGGYAASRDAVLGLTRFTEEITRTALLDIEQSAQGIRIERDDSFALGCDWHGQAAISTRTPFGLETCGWNGDRLVFQIDLDGLSIRHQLTLAPDRSQLNVTTTVQSQAVSSPFTMSSYFQRYVPRRDDQDYDCVFTLSRNNVCSQRGD